jgi:hypothetical protein
VGLKDRFTRLEPERSGSAPPARSGGQPGRFTGPEPALRALDLGQGQPFVRCARCRQDHHATAVRCTGCGADLTTRDQRVFNEALWKAHQQESAEEARAVDELRARRAQADREDAGAMRRREALEAELELRRGERGSWDHAGGRWGTMDSDARLVVAIARRAGTAIGGWLRRILSGGGR